MVVICEREKDIIREKMPHVYIQRTVRSKSNRHKYYMEENKNAMRLLQELRKSA